MSDSKKPSDDISADDLWAEAMNEQAATSSAAEPGDNVFKSLEASAASVPARSHRSLICRAAMSASAQIPRC